MNNSKKRFDDSTNDFGIRQLYEYHPRSILPGYEVRVQCYQSASESFEVDLRMFNPDKIFLFEPVLEFMRAVEIWNAERVKQRGAEATEEVEVVVLRYDDSTELYQNMTIIE